MEDKTGGKKFTRIENGTNSIYSHQNINAWMDGKNSLDTT